MKSAENIEKLIKNLDLHIDINTETDRAILGELSEAHEKSKKMKSASVESNTRRIIMKSPITKLAVAAAVIAVVVLGLVEFIGTGSTSGIVWAEVARKVQASSGVSFRGRETGSKNPNKDWPKGYTIVRRFPALSRTDWYQADQIRRTVFIDWKARTVTWLAHDARVYSKKTLRDEDVRTAEEEWTDPQALVGLFLSREYRELGRKMIDGVLCEGIETTDASGWRTDFPIKSFVGQLWVSVETGYPLLVEGEVTGGADGNLHWTSMADQFQWNISLDASEIEPEIPSDYSCID